MRRLPSLNDPVLVPSAVAGLINAAVAVTAHEVAEILAVMSGLRARAR